MIPQTRPLIYLIRHGQTAWSLSGHHTGHTDIPLSDAGRAEAECLAPALQGVAFSHVVTSPRLRARQTCELAGLASTAEIDPDLAEWNYGDYEGRLSRDIRMERPDWNIFRDGCPNGEMPNEVAARADRVLHRVAEAGGVTALFTHGHFGVSLGARWIGLPIEQAEHFVLYTASVSILGYDLGRGLTRVLRRWNVN